MGTAGEHIVANGFAAVLKSEGFILDGQYIWSEILSSKEMPTLHHHVRVYLGDTNEPSNTEHDSFQPNLA